MRIDNSRHMIAKNRAERLASDRRRLLLPMNRLTPATRCDESRSILRDKSLSANQNESAEARPALSLLSDVMRALQRHDGKAFWRQVLSFTHHLTLARAIAVERN